MDSLSSVSSVEASSWLAYSSFAPQLETRNLRNCTSFLCNPKKAAIQCFFARANAQTEACSLSSLFPGFMLTACKIESEWELFPKCMSQIWLDRQWSESSVRSTESALMPDTKAKLKTSLCHINVRLLIMTDVESSSNHWLSEVWRLRFNLRWFKWI